MSQSKQGSNSIRVFLTAELDTIISGEIPSDLHRNVWLTRKLLEVYKDKFVEQFGLEKWTEQHRRASRTKVQVRDENDSKREEKIRERMMKLEEEKIQIAKDKEARLREEFEVQKGNQVGIESVKQGLTDSEMTPFLLWLKETGRAYSNFKEMSHEDKMELITQFRREKLGESNEN